MGCGMCGAGGKPPKIWQLTMPDGTTSTYLTKTEALVASTANGGDYITRIDNPDTT